MTNNTKTKGTNVNQKYPLIRSTDGCDETFEVWSADDNRRIAWVGFWEADVAAKRSARKVAAFLDAVAKHEVRLDLGALVEELKAIAATWGWSELQQARPDLTDAQIWNVLDGYHAWIPMGYERPFPEELIEDAARIYPLAATP
jgi:hypothetical protein